MKLKEIANILEGQLRGDPEVEIKGVSGISDAKRGYITFLKDIHLLNELKASSASAVIVKEEIPHLDNAQVIVPNPSLSFAKLLELFYEKPREAMGIMRGSFIADGVRFGREVSIYPMVYIAKDVSIGSRTTIFPFVFIGESSQIGDDCVIYPNVTILEDIKVGHHVIIHSGTVIGSDGFGYVLDKGKHHKIPQVGGVIIEDDVEIGANVTIDRATTGGTLISAGTKIDNLVQIAHNVSIGKNSIVVAQVGIAGSSQIGDYVALAGQVGVTDHVKIDSQCVVGAQSGVISNLTKGVYYGTPVLPHRQFLKSQALFKRLPDMNKKVNELEKKIDYLYKNMSKQK